MTAETNAHETQHKTEHINIIINGTHYQLNAATLTGAQLAALADVPVGNQLFLEVAGYGDDQQIGPDLHVALHDGMHFYDVPIGNLG
jgi:hypothetical protein